ncbi:uncharacterized LabA/DUF88 family protein [Leucobacter luti]|uniref:NYN domain-containing protein n=1 Tax=Leucobacter luti TaxID=340320 RepID=UPI0010507D2E|nr:NYN domain-containing protein [Leucobacter luti]MCW2287315.1 uncharacterized LabA/DUF88 family protein [Leucobacter luti]TCK41538.1 uncharacterized LabA/DUF88 family protein [Leucobacter luti]
MADTQNGRVAVYLDFDNIVLSWYDRVHGRNSFSRDRQRIAEDPSAPDIAERLQAAAVDVGAIIDFASSFGTLVLTRAYADWSSHINAQYRSQLVARAVDLVQLFPAAAYAKNGADIRLAVDAVEDMFRLDDLSHVVIVGGDSDYVPLAQRCKRLGRYVVGIGVAGSTAKSLTAACDEFASYDALPGVKMPEPQQPAARSRRARAPQPDRESGVTKLAADTASAENAEGALDAAAAAAEVLEAALATVPEKAPRGRGSRRGRDARDEAQASADRDAPDELEELDHLHHDDEDDDADSDPELDATGLLIRALWLSQDKDDSGWLYSSAVKQQMRRMDPSFNERALGFRSFSDFLKSRADVAELEETGHERLVRLKDQNK